MTKYIGEEKADKIYSAVVKGVKEDEKNINHRW